MTTFFLAHAKAVEDAIVAQWLEDAAGGFSESESDVTIMSARAAWESYSGELDNPWKDWPGFCATGEDWRGNARFDGFIIPITDDDVRQQSCTLGKPTFEMVELAQEADKPVYLWHPNGDWWEAGGCAQLPGNEFKRWGEVVFGDAL